MKELQIPQAAYLTGSHHNTSQDMDEYSERKAMMRLQGPKT